MKVEEMQENVYSTKHGKKFGKQEAKHMGMSKISQSLLNKEVLHKPVQSKA